MNPTGRTANRKPLVLLGLAAASLVLSALILVHPARDALSFADHKRVVKLFQAADPPASVKALIASRQLTSREAFSIPGLHKFSGKQLQAIGAAPELTLKDGLQATAKLRAIEPDGKMRKSVFPDAIYSAPFTDTLPTGFKVEPGPNAKLFVGEREVESIRTNKVEVTKAPKAPFAFSMQVTSPDGEKVGMFTKTALQHENFVKRVERALESGRPRVLNKSKPGSLTKLGDDEPDYVSRTAQGRFQWRIRLGHRGEVKGNSIRFHR